MRPEPPCQPRRTAKRWARPRPGAVAWAVSLSAHAALAAVLTVAELPQADHASWDLRFARGGGRAGEEGLITLSLDGRRLGDAVPRKPAVSEPQPRADAAPPPAVQRVAPAGRMPDAGAPDDRFAVEPPPAAIDAMPSDVQLATTLASWTAGPGGAVAPGAAVVLAAAAPAAAEPELSWLPLTPAAVGASRASSTSVGAGPTTSAATARRGADASPASRARAGADAGDVGVDVPAPTYPRLSRRLGEEGEVVAEFELSARGAVEHIRVIRDAGHPRLAEAAVDALRRARARPPGGGRRILVRKSFHFRLH